MAKDKIIRHMGMTMTEEEHRRWHQEHRNKPLTDEEHKDLMKHLGVSPDRDRRWHRNRTASEQTAILAPSPVGQPVNPSAIGGGFLEYCIRQGWLTRRGRGRASKYFATPAGREALAGFGITEL